MVEKLKSRRFWIAVLSNIISITVVFKEIGGRFGIVCGIIGTIAASISYMITECKVDVARTKTTFEELSKLIKELKGVKENGKSST